MAIGKILSTVGINKTSRWVVFSAENSMQHEVAQKVWGAQLPIASVGRNGLAERTAAVRVYKCAISIITLMERDGSLAPLLQICFDLFARHGDDFWKNAFQNGSALNEAMCPRFAFRVGFPV